MKEYTYIKRVQVPVKSLTTGMYVGALDKPWEDSPFPFQGFPIEEQEQLELLRQECNYVFVDFKTQAEYEHHLQLANVETSQDAGRAEESKSARLSEELPEASDIFKESLSAIKIIKRKVMKSVAFDLNAIEHCMMQAHDSVQRNADAMMLILQAKNKIHYGAEHCIRVAMMAIAFGRHLGMSHDQQKLIGMGAALHDIGKMLLPAEIIEKAGKLNTEEALALTKYPDNSFRLLSRFEGLSDIVTEVAHAHREREDGRGYPRQMPKERVSRYAKIVSIIAAYDAITSDRSYSAALPANAAVKALIGGKGSKFDPQLVESFVQWLGAYPLGNLVEMSTGEIGIVLQNKGARYLQPRVMLVTDEGKQPGYQKTIDMRNALTRSTNAPYKIKSLLANQANSIHVEHFLELVGQDV